MLKYIKKLKNFEKLCKNFLSRKKYLFFLLNYEYQIIIYPNEKKYIVLLKLNILKNWKINRLNIYLILIKYF